LPQGDFELNNSEKYREDFNLVLSPTRTPAEGLILSAFYNTTVGTG
jgi:hypothetical protein